jgi:hypothetical protein
MQVDWLIVERNSINYYSQWHDRLYVLMTVKYLNWLYEPNEMKQKTDLRFQLIS